MTQPMQSLFHPRLSFGFVHAVESIAAGAVLDLFDCAGYTGTSISYSGGSLIYLSEFGYQYDQGSVFRVRYRKGDTTGPLSNELPEYVSW